ncbi:bifunctional VIP1 [Babesia duncani]|uniref:Inositol hexakisphosphate and diphosphoinositol-pentakisphosphate kinase n=1 Tax=Babesia duncani TaxID=323732 RepID=A0AAD9PH91_9APIC|nr:bifunctional VIP1 [Babesia duncani]KAK2195743.1 bifunctional VIP1 [Babesia duncani]
MRRIFSLGICTMASKLESAPMQSILEFMRSTGDFEIIIFPEETILNSPISEWPIVDCLIAFYSYKFPLEKAIEYVKRYKPVVLNDLEKQRIFRSRIDVYRELQVYHEAVKAGLHSFEEHYDYIVYNNVRINKPFIEKPVDSDDHNNWIYYPQNAGGGCKKLFRKIKDRSSMYCADLHSVRRDGMYIYEEFMSTFGTDIKVYTVGCMFAHAEARKSPSLDGKVDRYADGKEVRYPVILTSREKTIAYRIVDHFGQTVCGFDILRTIDGPYVCDINGWSFVKRNKKYHMDCSHIMRIMFLLKLEAKYNIILRNVIPARFVASETVEALKKTFADIPGRFTKSYQEEELTSVIVVMRHGDRKPKQKLKFITREPTILQYFDNLHCVNEIKLKSPEEMTTFVKINDNILSNLQAQMNSVENQTINGQENIKEDFKILVEAVTNHKELEHVLKIGKDFTGINRKIQLKPIYDSDGILNAVLVVVKWGGELTNVGATLAEDLGRRLRQTLYPTDSSGLIRLHSTFRHDLKIYSSDEGRCQITSAAFTKGLLDLDGELTPILVAMTIRDKKAHALLDDNLKVPERGICKQRLKEALDAWDNKQELERVIESIPEGHHYKEILEQIGYSSSDLVNLYDKMVQFMAAVKDEISKWRYLYPIEKQCHKIVAILHDIHLRWKRLGSVFFNGEKFIYSNIPDILDAVRYDLIHHHSVLGNSLNVALEIYNVVQRLASVLSPSEYGVTPKEKLLIGIKVVRKLLEKILHDITAHRDSKENLSNKLNDIHRNRDLLYATLVAPNGVGNQQSSSGLKNELFFGGSSEVENTSPSRGITPTPRTPSYQNTSHDTSNVSNNDGNKQRMDCDTALPISVVAAASASAASVAAACLAISSIPGSGVSLHALNASNKSSFIGGIKPSEMYMYGGNLAIDETIRLLETKPSEPCVINSSHLWVHCKPDVSPSRAQSAFSAHSMDEDGNLVQLETSGAKTLGIQSPTRRVRSRYYVTSASHLFSLYNFFKHAHNLDNGPEDSVVRFKDDSVRDLHYLSHIVIRVWTSLGKDKKHTYRLEILVSMGAVDGFDQNYELLKKNANLLGKFYRNKLQQYNLDYVDNKVICKSCEANVDYPLFKNQKITNENEKNSSDQCSFEPTQSTCEGLTDKVPLDWNIHPALRTLDPNKGTVYFCQKCCAQVNLKMETKVTSTRIPVLDEPIVSGISQVPPYCELGKLLVKNYNCKLSTLEHYIIKVSVTIFYYYIQAIEIVGPDINSST